jgi:methionyl-tRNA formyltransferase
LSTIFLGTSEFAAGILERLARSELGRPVLVITRPDRPSGRGRRLSAPPVAERAKALELPLEQPESVNDAGARELIARAAVRSAAREPGGSDGGARPTVVVCAFGALIREPLLCEHDILNVHPSLLPRWRGAAPIERAIMAGDPESGVSIMRLTAGLDSGPVCLAEAEPIRGEDTYGTLAARLQALGGELLVRALGQAPPFREQPEDGVTYAEKLDASDRLLDPGRPAGELERAVRALHPHIGARVELADGTMLGVHRAVLFDPGEEERPREAAHGPAQVERGVRAHGARLLLDCSPGVLELLVVQPPGARTMDASAYLRGRGLPGRR